MCGGASKEEKKKNRAHGSMVATTIQSSTNQ
jgi:hypothetical protein